MENKPDRLTLCVMAASEAGMSYGKYMALHGYHPPVQRRPPKPEMLESPVPTRVCGYCGKVFSMEGRSHNSKYCSPECQRRQGERAYMAKYREKQQAGVPRQNKEKPETRICVVCGKEIPLSRHGKAKTCSLACALERENQRQREYYHRKKGRTNGKG